MTFSEISDAVRLERLRPPVGRVRMVLDTDTYSETRPTGYERDLTDPARKSLSRRAGILAVLGGAAVLIPILQRTPSHVRGRFFPFRR